MVSFAPNARVLSSRESARSIATTLPGPYSLAVMMAADLLPSPARTVECYYPSSSPLSVLFLYLAANSANIACRGF